MNVVVRGNGKYVRDPVGVTRTMAVLAGSQRFPSGPAAMPPLTAETRKEVTGWAWEMEATRTSKRAGTKRTK